VTVVVGRSNGASQVGKSDAPHKSSGFAAETTLRRFWHCGATTLRCSLAALGKGGETLLLSQEIERQLIGFAVEVLEQGVVEDGVVGGSSQK